MSSSNNKKEKEGKTIRTINPTTEQVINEYKVMSKEQIINTIKKAREAFHTWRKQNVHSRANFLYGFAAELRKNKKNWLKLLQTKWEKPYVNPDLKLKNVHG